MNKKIVGIFVILLILISILILPTHNVFAVSDVFEAGDKFLENGTNNPINMNAMKTTSDKLYNILFSIGIVVMFIVGTIIGIKLIVASAEDRAKVKESLIPYIVGCVVILGAFTIWKIVVDIGNSL